MTRIRGLGFDLGETLMFYRDTPLNWSALYSKALRAVASVCGHLLTREQLASAETILAGYNTRITPRTNEIEAETILSGILQAWGVDAAKYSGLAVDAFFNFFQQNVSSYPETIEVLALLRKRGIPTGVLTDVPYGMPRQFVERDLERAGISGFFDVLLTSVEIGVRKPQPDGYVALATKLGIFPHEMMYVGNEPKDVIGACEAGSLAVFLDRADVGGTHGQHFTIVTLSSIDDILSSVNS